MSNINPNPTFRPYGGRDAAAASAHFPYQHRDLSGWVAGELAKERRKARAEAMRGICRTCKGKSPLWKVGHCPACNNTGKPS